MIIQGDSYALPIELKQGDTIIIPAMIDGLIIQLGDTEYKYPSAITYDDGQWLISLTQAQTLKFGGYVSIQAQIKMTTGDILNTVPDVINVQNALIKKVWA